MISVIVLVVKKRLLLNSTNATFVSLVGRLDIWTGREDESYLGDVDAFWGRSEKNNEGD